MINNEDYNNYNQDNMELPIKNREELSSRDTLVVSKLKYRIAIITSAFSLVGLIITGLIPLAGQYLTSEHKILEREAKRQQNVNKILDSIDRVESEKEIKLMFKNVSKIYEEIARLKKELPKSASVSIYSTHNSGGIPRSGSLLHVTVLYEATNVGIIGGKPYWQNRVVPKGYFNLVKKTYENGEAYYFNVKDHPEIYIGETKNDFEYNNIKILYNRLIKVTPTDVYYLSVSYTEDCEDFHELSKLRLVSRNYVQKFKPLLQSKSRF